MRNPRISNRERGLLKGAIRRVFSRSDLRQTVISASVVRSHIDRTRPRVKTWCRCAICGECDAKSSMQVDHKNPIVPVTTSLSEMSWDDLINNLWCETKNLDSVCGRCHDIKTQGENVLRRKHKKENK